MFVWVFLVLAIAATAATVVYGGLAARAPKRSAERKKYVRTAIVTGVLTLVTVAAGGLLTWRARNADGASFPNDLVQDVGNDTFLETLAATTS